MDLDRWWQRTRRTTGKNVFPGVFVAAGLKDWDPGPSIGVPVLLVHLPASRATPDKRLFTEVSGTVVSQGTNLAS